MPKQVRAYRERKSLAHSLNDTKTAVQQLHKLASVVSSVIIIVVSLLVMGVASTKVFVAITSQLLLLGFFFQSTGKTLFESIVFVFIMHPFDVGDRCVIDGIQMIVEEMNILTTVFLRYDNEKIYYPNAVLLTKPISNFYRSPHMFDTIEFAIDVSTHVDTIASFRKSIQA
ncbi:Mechanosensitive ion channel protein 4 [Platanthera guangdongensis]|uniref:Mechanosensitive ion channel protein 4 n=1 Tax=Platanthera guangdongensis TaxID=2320717 RepID=A0ABR2LR32_9ASPA